MAATERKQSIPVGVRPALVRLACALTLLLAPGVVRAQDTTSVSTEFQRLIDRLRHSARLQDSLAALAD